jgi:hypothetical protein
MSHDSAELAGQAPYVNCSTSLSGLLGRVMEHYATFGELFREWNYLATCAYQVKGTSP